MPTNGANEETVQASVTNDSQLNNSRRLPTNDIQENTSQNIEPGYNQIGTSVESIADELQTTDRTPASADTETVTGTGTSSYRSRDEPDPTLVDQLRLVTLREYDNPNMHIFSISYTLNLKIFLCFLIPLQIRFMYVQKDHNRNAFYP